jgi:hypothetical protein|tara:strand:- start:278 stop:478 length:201 start_codon:yes stop_codon:yes gene_type:complete
MKLTFEQEKETKNTIRFQEVPEAGKPPVIGTLYIQKWAIGQEVPQTLSVKIENFADSTLTPAETAV